MSKVKLIAEQYQDIANKLDRHEMILNRHSELLEKHSLGPLPNTIMRHSEPALAGEESHGARNGLRLYCKQGDSSSRNTAGLRMTSNFSGRTLRTQKRHLATALP